MGVWRIERTCRAAILAAGSPGIPARNAPLAAGMPALRCTDTLDVTTLGPGHFPFWRAQDNALKKTNSFFQTFPRCHEAVFVLD